MTPDPLVDALCDLLRTGELSPGQRVDQRAISARLNVSRTPLREALRALASDGILTRAPNAGYAVAKLSAQDLLQYYSIRKLLESEVLRTLECPGTAGIDELRRLNDVFRTSVETEDIDGLIAANREFHHLMFGWSPLAIFRQEIERVWRVSDPYRALQYLSHRNTRMRAADDHDDMIQAILDRDPERLVALMDRHRTGTQQLLEGILGSAPAFVSFQGPVARPLPARKPLQDAG
jgi:DNA-binding GntR family transcriptional regulator